MKTVLHRSPGATQVMHRDAHDPNRQVFRTEFHDDHALAQNQRIRSAGLMKRGDEVMGMPVHFAFSIPSVEKYNDLIRRYPDLMLALKSRDASIFLPAAKRFAKKFPEYCVLKEDHVPR